MRITISLFISIILLACGASEPTSVSQEESMVQKIEALEKQLWEGSSTRVDQLAATKMISAYKALADTFPENKTAPEYLFKAGEVAMGIQQYNISLSFYQRIAKDYPNYNKVAECVYLQAFIYDNHIEQKEKAKAMYKQVIERFPEHQFAKDATAAIENLYLTDEELIKKFQKMNANTDSIQVAS